MTTKIKILNVPIGEGKTCVVYKLHDITRDKILVGKIPKGEMTLEEAAQYA